MFFTKEAESCRKQAAAYVGQPEGPFLLKVARAFEDLAAAQSKAVQLNRRDSLEGHGLRQSV
jgi:hypothetical protein